LEPRQPSVRLALPWLGGARPRQATSPSLSEGQGCQLEKEEEEKEKEKSKRTHKIINK